MSVNDIKKLLTIFFHEKWEGKTPISFENKIDKYEEGDVSFVRMFVKNTTGSQQTLGGIGSRMFRRNGYLIFQVYTPSGKGTQEADEISQSILDIFETNDVGNIFIRQGSVTYEGSSGKWYNQNVQFSISYDEFK